jgi:hypothetical protein
MTRKACRRPGARDGGADVTSVVTDQQIAAQNSPAPHDPQRLTHPVVSVLPSGVVALLPPVALAIDTRRMASMLPELASRVLAQLAGRDR